MTFDDAFHSVSKSVEGRRGKDSFCQDRRDINCSWAQGKEPLQRKSEEIQERGHT